MASRHRRPHGRSATCAVASLVSLVLQWCYQAGPGPTPTIARKYRVCGEYQLCSLCALSRGVRTVARAGARGGGINQGPSQYDSYFSYRTCELWTRERRLSPCSALLSSSPRPWWPPPCRPWPRRSIRHQYAARSTSTAGRHGPSCHLVTSREFCKVTHTMRCGGGVEYVR